MFWIRSRIGKKKGVLILIGADPNGELSILYPGYKLCYVFEANPNRFYELKKKYSSKAHIHIFNYAVAENDGEIELNISSNNFGASSSLGNFNSDWQRLHSDLDIKMIDRVTVKSINLFEFCKKNNISYVDDYISDIQGMDLQVLKTMSVFINEKKIGTIKCEVTKNEFRNIYSDLPDNSEDGFTSLLEQNYTLVAKGFGLLIDNYFSHIPTDSWEMDCKWRVKA